jgi:hypothetical protein
MRTINRLLTISMLVAATACGGDDGTVSTDDGTADGDDGPGAGACSVVDWAAPDFEANAASGLALRAQLDALAGDGGFMNTIEQEGEEIGYSELSALFEEGNPSLAYVAPPGYAPVLSDKLFADFAFLSGAGVQDLIDNQGNWAPGEVGGFFFPEGADHPRGMNAGGLEIRQLVDKGLLGGAFYNYALQETWREITPADIDNFAAAWGSNDVLSSVEDELTDSAKYSFRMGFHATMAEALTAAKSYAADQSCAAELDDALVTFFRAWEQSLVASTIYYANVASGMLADATEDVEKLDALHLLAEGIGLTVGFQGLEASDSGPFAGAGRLLTDEDIEAMRIALGVDFELNASTTGTFVEDPAALADGVATYEAIAVEVFELSEEDLEAYRTPTKG